MKICSVCQRCYDDEVLFCTEENHDSLAESRPGSREIIPGFRLDCLLEVNRAGETFQATNIALNQSCIVKIIAAGLSDDEQNLSRQFQSEARSMATLNHPNVVRVYEFGVLPDGEFYVVTEAAGGQTLRDCLSQVGSPSEVTAIQIARQTAEGLEAIHAAGTVHRNISPENIILTSDAENRLLVKIQNLDFGGFRRQVTMSERKLDELRYFSPEQCAGQEEIDAQTDIYSLGIVLYEMLAGHPPFDAPDAAALIEKQINEPPPEVEISNFDIRALLTQTLLDSLRKLPRIRLKTANLMARRLRHVEQVATHLPLPAPPVISVSPVTDKPAAAAPKPLNNKAAAPAAKPNNSFPVAGESSVTPISETQADTTPAIPEPPPVVSASPENQVIESPIIENESEIDSPPMLAEETEIDEVLLDSKPILIEWEQPADIPSESEVLEVKREEFGETEIDSPMFSMDEEYSFTVTDEPDSMTSTEIETEEFRGPASMTGDALFSSYAVNESPRFPLSGHSLLIGAVFAALLILAVTGGAWLNGQFQSLDSSSAQTPTITTTTTAQSAPPSDQILPESEDESGVSKNDVFSSEKPLKTISNDETAKVNNPDTTDSKVISIKAQPPVTSEKSLSTPAKRRNQTPKEIADSSTPRMKQKATPDKKPANKRNLSTPTKNDIFSRPRIVKTAGS